MNNYSPSKTRHLLPFLCASVAAALFLASPIHAQDASDDAPFPPDEIDSLTAPVALYPDPLLAQVLPAATFPDQIDEAARYLRSGMDPNAVDTQDWDISVKSVAHYPTLLYMMADRLDWTTALGQAYVNQEPDVVNSIQRMRSQALYAGNLVSNPEQQVVQDANGIEIWPAQPQEIYVPSYDPDYVYYSGYEDGPAISFGTGYPIGAWLDFDFDWQGRRIYHHGWDENTGWVGRSRSFVHASPVYAAKGKNQNVTANRSVVNRPVNFANVTTSHHTTSGNVAASNNGATRHNTAVATTTTVTPNRMIQRNINTSDPQLESLRGRQAHVTSAATQTAHPQQTVVQAPAQNRRQTFARPQPTEQHAAPQPQHVAQVSQHVAVQAAPHENPVFQPSHSGFTANQESQRGQASRAAASHPTMQARAGGQPHPNPADKGKKQ
jgi:hypothetical protein